MSGDRRALLAKVHVARKQMALTEDSYRAVVRRITAKNSSSDCTEPQLVALVEEFRRLGWKARPLSGKPYVRKIYALWGELKPYLSDSSTPALAAFVRRQTMSLAAPQGVGSVEWLDANQANRVTEGLKAWLRREKAKADA